MKMKFHQNETTIKSKLARIPELLNQYRSHRVGFEAEDHNCENSSAQFLQMQKNQIMDGLAGTFREILQYITSLCVQLCEVRYQLNQELLNTDFRDGRRC